MTPCHCAKGGVEHKLCKAIGLPHHGRITLSVHFSCAHGERKTAWMKDFFVKKREGNDKFINHLRILGDHQ